MRTWLIILAMGGLTYGLRLSFVLLLERWQPPELLERGLRFVPPAVLSAIILPELVMHDGGVNLTLTNPRLLAGALAVLVSWRTKNTLLTIVVGMVALLVLQWAFG